MPVSPLISVIIPVYNNARYLGEALDSVRAQTYRSFEIIVVDDGSTDGMARVAQVADVRYFHQANAGCGAARNTGVKHARGKFVAFLDHDDLWGSDKLAWQMAAWNELPESNAPQLIFGHVKQFFSPELSEASCAAVHLPEAPQPGTLASALFTTLADFRRVGPYTANMPDFDWFLRARDSGAGIHVLPQVLLFRRIHEANFGRTCGDQKKQYAQALKASLDRQRAAK